jgi:peptidoglycan-N-acetylglucosamine deacetylase
MKYLYNPPSLVKRIFNSSKWSTSNGRILVTFDDGPVLSNTGSILKKLNEYNIKSLFFCVGNNIKKEPGVVKEILSQGHTIGNHTMNHSVLLSKGLNIIAAEVLPFNKIAEDNFGIKVKYFRPPHGKLNYRINSFIKDAGLTNIMWSLLTYDYTGDIRKVKTSMQYLRYNSIVVFHDSMKSKEIISRSIDLLAEEINKNDFKTGTPDECLN